MAYKAPPRPANPRVSPKRGGPTSGVPTAGGKAKKTYTRRESAASQLMSALSNYQHSTRSSFWETPLGAGWMGTGMGGAPGEDWRNIQSVSVPQGLEPGLLTGAIRNVGELGERTLARKVTGASGAAARAIKNAPGAVRAKLAAPYYVSPKQGRPAPYVPKAIGALPPAGGSSPSNPGRPGPMGGVPVGTMPSGPYGAPTAPRPQLAIEATSSARPDEFLVPRPMGETSSPPTIKTGQSSRYGTSTATQYDYRERPGVPQTRREKTGLGDRGRNRTQEMFKGSQDAKPRPPLRPFFLSTDDEEE